MVLYRFVSPSFHFSYLSIFTLSYLSIFYSTPMVYFILHFPHDVCFPAFHLISSLRGAIQTISSMSSLKCALDSHLFQFSPSFYCFYQVYNCISNRHCISSWHVIIQHDGKMHFFPSDIHRCVITFWSGSSHFLKWKFSLFKGKGGTAGRNPPTKALSRF